MEIISANALISINATFFAQLASFLLFMFILNKIMVGPLREINSKRDGYIDTIQDKISNNKDQLNVMLLEFEKKKTDVIKKSLVETSEIEDKAQTKALEIYTSARNEIANLRETSEKEIHEHITELRVVLNTNIDDIVELVTGKILENRRLAK